MGRGWLVVLTLLLSTLLVAPAPHHHRDDEAEEKGYVQRAWTWIKQAADTVKGWVSGDHSLFNQLKSKLKENRTITVLGKKVTFTLPDPSSSSSSSDSDNVHWGSSFSSLIHNLKREPVLRVLLALYINIVIFIAVYGYLVTRHIMLSINLKKAAQPEKERERRRQKERRKEVKRIASETRRGRGIANPALLSPPLSSEGGNNDTIRSTDFVEEINMDRLRCPMNSLNASEADIEIYSTPTQALASE